MDHQHRKRVYISGPLTSSGDALDNVQVAINAAKKLIAAGYAPLCPHLTFFIDPHAEIAHSVWMEIDLPWVAVSDAVLRIPGDSRGAEQECCMAIDREIPVFHNIDELIEELGV